MSDHRAPQKPARAGDVPPLSPALAATFSRKRSWRLYGHPGGLSRPIHGGDRQRAALRSANRIWTPGPSTVQLYLADSVKPQVAAVPAGAMGLS